jgi:hypothetical protein
MEFEIFIKRFIIVIVISVLLLFHKSYAQDLSVPINIEGNNIYIMARINGIPIRFVLDTGADSLVLPAQYATMANLPAGKQTTINLAGGSTTAAITTIASRVGVESKTIYNVPAIIMRGGDPLFGQSVLQRFGNNVTIDYERRIVIFNYRGRDTLQTSPLELSLLGLSGRYSSSLNPGKGQIQLVSVRVNPDRTMVGNIVLSTPNCGHYGQFSGHFYDSAIVVSMTALQDGPSCPVGSGARVGRIDVTLRLSESGWVGTYQSQFPDAGVIEMTRRISAVP